MYMPCKVEGCDHKTPVPEDPDKLQGPEVGELRVYSDPLFPQWHGLVVEVLRRSYVWSPEVHVGMNAHGYRLYDVSVIRFGEPLVYDRMTMFVDDSKLLPLEVGMRIQLDGEEE